ncbi:glycosyltransferase family 2 protein [Acetobacter fallax]|uniref:Glycosyl transferase family 2 n=1 Tax=Acetobacter fallax TaxID=1737473 RepID=A0ABX0KC69_9PROT|nr:glycosyltransferase family 2 protein [Acetobacter fallax]NHO32651.1 hypothetical protein [Acetobacter fallax]NHO36151.1 hypothetical protein [Acetobacter fallax]
MTRSPHSPTHTLAARCVTMQKNETTLLEPWLLHHGALFGFSALTVIDNGSDDPVVLDILRRYEASGVTVLRDYATKEDFVRKGDIVADVIRGWDRDGGYAFALPLDCDEFIVTMTGSLAWDRDSVFAALARMADQQATFVNNRVLLNVPSRPGYFRPQIIRRAIFAANTIVSLDHGFHNPGTIYPDRWGQSLLACLHLHNRPRFTDIQRAAHEKLRHLIGDADPASVSPTSEGYHLYSYFRIPEADFLKQYRDHPDIYAPGLLSWFEEIGIDWHRLLGTGGVQLPVTPPAGFLVHKSDDDERRHRFVQFDAAFYAATNPDVAQDAFYGQWPLLHYITSGWDEGRLPNGQSLPPIVVEQEIVD